MPEVRTGADSCCALIVFRRAYVAHTRGTKLRELDQLICVFMAMQAPKSRIVHVLATGER
jgi:hypothetical protein